MRFFGAASDGATANCQIPNHIFGQFFTSLRKDSVANNASIWTQFSPIARGLDVFYKSLNDCSYSGKWRYKIRKFAVKIFQNVKIGRRVVPNNSVTIYIVINSTHSRRPIAACA